jgi:hypothetical protein
MSDGDTTLGDPPSPAPPRRAPSRRRHERIAHVITGLAALAGAFAGCEPTGTAVVDPVLTAALAAVITVAASRARRWPTFALAVVALVMSQGLVLVPAGAAAASVFLGASRDRRSRVWGAATGALAAQSLLRLPDTGPHGTTALAVAVATTPVLVSAYRALRPEARRPVHLAVGGVLGSALLVTVAYAGLLLLARGTVDRAVTSSQTGLAQARLGDTAAAETSFAAAEDDFARADRLLGGWWAAPARVVPVVAQHTRAVAATADEGVALAATARDTAETADYERARYTDGRFDLALIASVEDPLRRTSEAITRSRQVIAEHRSPWLIGPVGDRLDRFDDELARTAEEADLAREAVALAPALLGAEGPRRYLVLFVTPAELRGSGGFIGSYAELVAEDGRLELVRTGSAGALEGGPQQAEVTGPEDYLTRYGRFAPGAHFRDLTYSPHFPYDAAVVDEVYPQLTGSELDGVISIDPIALAELMRFTGPIAVPGFGRTLDATTAAPFLLEENYALFPDNEAQTAALTELTEATFDRLTTGDLPGPRAMGAVLGPVTRSGHLRAWSQVPAEQALLARMGATGALPDPRPDRDMFAVASQNSGNNKIDVYQRRTIDYEVAVDDEGRLEATATIVVRNETPTAELPPYVVANRQGDPPGTNTMLLSIYTPHQLEEATLDGRTVGVESQQEAGFRVYTRLVSVPPGASTTLVVRLSGTLDVEDGYRLDVAPHPTVNPDVLTVRCTLGDARQVVRSDRPLVDRTPVTIE